MDGSCFAIDCVRILFEGLLCGEEILLLNELDEGGDGKVGAEGIAAVTFCEVGDSRCDEVDCEVSKC